MIHKGRFTAFFFIWAAISLPFVFLHLVAQPDDAPISLVQHLVAALANLFGPWGAAIVRAVDFPNAGWRSFSWGLALGLTLAGGLVVGWRGRVQGKFWRVLVTGVWALFSLVWFGIGFLGIADGLL